jgi:hypothetical protein
VGVGSGLYLSGGSAQLMRLLHLADIFPGTDVVPDGRM